MAFHDKVTGALAGLRAPLGGGAAAPGAAQVAAGSSFHELLVGADGDTLLRARLSTSGAVEWAAVPADDVPASHRAVVAQSQMSGMLRDRHRNETYRAALTGAIREFTDQQGRPPVVLDIGAGTGLLSLLAAEAGAASVVACEQWGVMASVARSVLAANPRWGPAVTVLARHSSDVTAADLSAGGGRADVIVSEILDSALLGEGVVPALRDAFARLLTPASTACVVPLGGVMHAQLIRCPALQSWQDTALCRLPSRGEEGDSPSGTPLHRTDWSGAGGCRAASGAIPVHASLLPDCTPVTAPFDLYHIDFTPAGLDAWGKRVAAPAAETVVVPALPGATPGPANGILLWWDCVIGGHVSPQFVYSTAAESVAAQGWQDHWTQVVVPLPTPVLPSEASSSAPPSFTIATSLAEVGAPHIVVGPAGAAVWPSKRAHKLAAKAAAAAASPTSSHAATLPSPAALPLLFMEPEPCSCGLHRVTNYERRWMLSSPAWGGAFAHAVDAVLSSSSVGEGARAAHRPLAVLSIGEGSLCAVAAASSPSTMGGGLLPGVRVVAVEAHEEMEVHTRAVLEAASSASSAAAHGMRTSVLLLDPLEPIAPALAAALAEEEGEEEEEGGQSSEEGSTGGGDAAYCSESGGVPTAAVEPPPHPVLFDALLLEPFFASLQHMPLVELVHAYLVRHAVAPLLQPSAAIMPCRARVWLQAVSLLDLHGMQGPVGTVCGLDHSPYDALVADWADCVTAFPLWQYKHTAVSAPTRVLELDFASSVAVSAKLLTGSTVLSPRVGDEGEGEGAPTVNAIVCWVEYQLTPSIVASTGGTGWRHHVKFLPHPLPFANGSDSLSVKLSLHRLLEDGRLVLTAKKLFSRSYA